MKSKPWLRKKSTLLLLLLAPLFGCGGSSAPSGSPPPPPPPPPGTLALSTFVSGLSSPVDLEQPNDGTGRFFVVQQPGTIRVISGGSLLPNNFLDIHSKVDSGGEMGLLGIAFHPSYSSNKRFFLDYDRNNGGQLQTVIAEYIASASDPNLADPNSERILLTVNQPFTNHKGGQLAFGPDGFLYIALGDGGGGGDPFGNGQNLFALLGKVLRIDVDHMDPGLQYAIPPGNPFVGGLGLPEIWAYGLRNPWRFSFERGGSRLYVGDVGQNNWEEVDLLEKGGNFGWNVMEGMHCYPPGSSCNMSGKILPIMEYDHSEGIAVIGGYVYKGSAIPGLAGMYIFGDLNGKIWSLNENPPGTWTRTLLLDTGRTISGFGQDASGEVYVLDYGGIVLKLVPQ